MASEFSFDIVSQVDMNEVKNAFNTANKELMNRYDLKGTKCEIELEDDHIMLTADDDFRLTQVFDILFSKLVKREVDARMIVKEDPQAAGGMTIKQKITFKQGIEQSQAKDLSKKIKDAGTSAKSQVQGDAVRVSSKSKDDLQKVINYVKALDLPYAVNFINYR
ncbi:MAG: YajQ family cyclic di-GMP-binding protein [Fimbriimonadaceae bacterium]|nr:YajQ family cyclic di-GMP-binding protein [Armatimonadota bacterium]